MNKLVKDMTDIELIKEMIDSYPPGDHTMWRFEDVCRELEARKYYIEERSTIEAIKDYE